LSRDTQTQRQCADGGGDGVRTLHQEADESEDSALRLGCRYLGRICCSGQVNVVAQFTDARVNGFDGHVAAQVHPGGGEVDLARLHARQTTDATFERSGALRAVHTCDNELSFLGSHGLARVYSCFHSCWTCSTARSSRSWTCWSSRK